MDPTLEVVTMSTDLPPQDTITLADVDPAHDDSSYTCGCISCTAKIAIRRRIGVRASTPFPVKHAA